MKPDNILIDQNGNLVDKKKNPILDAVKTPINVRGTDLNSKLDSLIPHANKKGGNLFYCPRKKSILNPTGGYFDANGMPAKEDDIFLDQKGNLIDRKRNTIQDQNGTPINIKRGDGKS